MKKNEVFTCFQHTLRTKILVIGPPTLKKRPLLLCSMKTYRGSIMEIPFSGVMVMREIV